MTTRLAHDSPQALHAATIGAAWLAVARRIIADGIVSRYDDTAAQSPFAGLLKMGPYRLQKVAPRNGVSSLNAAIEGLGRAGNSLQQFDGLLTPAALHAGGG